MKLGKISVMMTAVLCVLCGCADVRQADGTETVPLSETSAEVQTAAEHIPEDDYKYVIENGEAHIKKYLGDETEIIVPDSLEGCPVTLVSSTAFGYNVTSLTFPETITGFTAFKSLDKLREVNISEGGEYKSVDGTVYTADGSELVFLPPCACEGVFTVPEGVVKIADNACYGSKAAKIILPRSLREIGVFAFAYSDISEVKLNEGLEAIGANAFANTSGRGLSELYLPDSVILADTGFVNADVRVNAKAETEGLSCLEDLDDVYYRDDTEVQRIMRRGLKAINITDDESRVIFTDIDGDDFPEMICYPFGSGINAFSLYKYSDSSEKWKILISTDYDIDYYCGIYRDRESGGYFFLRISEGSYVQAEYATKIMWTPDGEYTEGIGESGLFYPIGYYSDNKGYVTYFKAGNRFEIKTYSSEEIADVRIWNDFKEFVKGSLDGCEPVREISCIDHFKMLEEYPDKKVIYDGDFYDKPEKSKGYDLTMAERSLVGQIGGTNIYRDTSTAFLQDDDISYKSFELLSQLPGLTYLYINGSNTADLSGIELLSGLKMLDLHSPALKNTDSLAKLSELEWLNIGAMSDISFLADMDSVRVLGIGDTSQMPDDYFSPAYDMDSLEYLLVSCWDENITEEQQADFKAHRPDVELCFYKVG